MSPTLTCRGATAVVGLCRPAQANRLGLEDLAVLASHLEAVEADRQVRVLVIRSEGPTFCSGFNLDDWAQTAGSATPPQRFSRVMDRLATLRPVTIAALQGPCYGGGVDLAMACDLRVATAQVAIAVPAVRLGLQFYRSGLERALRQLPWPLVQRLFLLGERLQPNALQGAGWCHQWVDVPEDLPAEVDALVAQLLALAPLALEGVKQAMSRVGRGGLMSAEDAQQVDALAAATEASWDLQEGVAAWLAGRPPQFEGR